MFIYLINLLYIHTPPITIIASITSPIRIDAITFIIKDIITSNTIKTIIPIIMLSMHLTLKIQILYGYIRIICAVILSV